MAENNILNNKSIPQKRRTTPEQLEYYVEFVRSHPKLLRSKNSSASVSQVSKLWEELAANLNAMNGPTRSVTKWRETMSQWKNQLQCRARKAKVQRTKNGDAEPWSATELKNFDKLVLETFGSITGKGLAGATTVGLQEAVIEEASPTITTRLSTEDILDNLKTEEESEFLSEPLTMRDLAVNKEKKSSVEIVRKLMELIEKRNEREIMLHEDNLQTQKLMAESLRTVGEGMKAMGVAIKTLCDTMQQMSKKN